VAGFNKRYPLDMINKFIYFGEFDKILLLEELAQLFDEGTAGAVQDIPSLSVFVDVDACNLKKFRKVSYH
jgi:hypothetical protein